MFAIFEDVGFSEILILGVAGVLLFGRRLPEVAAQAGQQLVKFRRSLQQVKAESGIDQEVRKIQRTFEEAIPRDLSVGEVARLASARVQERIQGARKELENEVQKPIEPVNGAAPPAAAPPAAATPTAPSPAVPSPAEAAHDATRVGPPASDATIARTREPGPSAPGADQAPPAAG